MATQAEREALWAELEAMPGFLEEKLGALPAETATLRGPADAFAPVEHCWHLADLEREGYAVRIRRLLSEEHPFLPGFDGARVARDRDYRARALTDGLAAFRSARQANLALLRAVPESAWSREGAQEGVGALTLDDLPRLMRAHDASHRAEILAWLEAR